MGTLCGSFANEAVVYSSSRLWYRL